jgi:hypothetical protein
MMLRLTTIAAALTLLTAGAPVLAQTAEQRAACEADAKKMCPGIQPGGGRILDCLAKQKDKLSDACKKVVASQGR